MTRSRRTYRECTPDEADYWRVTCAECGVVAIKASERNVWLAEASHAKARHQSVLPTYTVTPLVLVEANRV